DSNGGNDVFLYDWTADKLTLVSAHASSISSATALGLSFAGPDSISADGRQLVFLASAQRNFPGDVAGDLNVYLRDLVTATNRLISIGTNGTSPANGASRTP